MTEETIVKRSNVAAVTWHGPRLEYRRMAEKHCAKLPLICFVTQPVTGYTVGLKRGEPGYYPLDRYERFIPPDELNATLERVPTKAEIAAMQCGSMFGYDSPGADPDSHFHTG